MHFWVMVVHSWQNRRGNRDEINSGNGLLPAFFASFYTKVSKNLGCQVDQTVMIRSLVQGSTARALTFHLPPRDETFHRAIVSLHLIMTMETSAVAITQSMVTFVWLLAHLVWTYLTCDIVPFDSLPVFGPKPASKR